MKQEINPDKTKALEDQNLKLEFEISRLNRDNARLKAEVGFLRGRGVKLLMHEIIHKVDSKISHNLKRLNKSRANQTRIEELSTKLSANMSRSQLLHTAQAIDLKSYYILPRLNPSYAIALGLYKASFKTALFGGRTLWRGWSKVKQTIKKAK